MLLADNNETYKGSTFNAAMAFEPSCIHFAANTAINNEHFAVLGTSGYCDKYTDDSQTYLRESIYAGAGIMMFSESLYRDSFYLSLSVSLEKAWMREAVSREIGDSYAGLGVALIGYQWHFKKGYILSLMGYFSYLKPFSYNAADEALKAELKEEKSTYTPTFFIGWRF